MTDEAKWAKHLAALYEIKRQAFLIGYLQNPRKFSDALAFAYSHRMSPIFHEQSARQMYGGDPFEEVYWIKSDFITDLLKYIDEHDLAKDYEPLEFYNLEETFGGYKANRIELIYALEYIRISGRFNDEVWKAIERNAPMEANSIDSTFSPDEVEFH